MSSDRETARGEAHGGGLGTFAGVFTPSILTILGIILFLRMGFVVGQAGLVRALLIILAANTISVLTSLSLSAIATNLRVKGGGDYYLISRTLGVEFGGALGLVLFLAQAVSIAFYSIGFGEAVTSLLARLSAAGFADLGALITPYTPQVVAGVAVAALFVLAWLGSDWATRFQYVVMAVLFAALVAFLIGGAMHWDTERLQSNLAPTGDLPFWAIFAIFFPAVTGFTQGVSLSGDLRDPGRSLPRGTFAAVGLSLVIYLAVAVLFAASVAGDALVNDTGVMRQVSLVGWLVDAGVIAATLSSALASYLGAPRILQSLARDRVFPWLNPFAVGSGDSQNPRRGVLLATVIAFGTILAGDLNFIAPVVSMFFLVSYGLLNYATYVEAAANSPSFRPRFRFFDKRLSLLGGLACLGAMLAIHPTAGLIAVALLFAIHQYVAASVSVERWADSGRSRRFQRLRTDLLAILAEPEHPRYWRPILLAFSDDPERRERLLRFANWLEGGSGITTLVRLVDGEGARGRKLRTEVEAELTQQLKQLEVKAFPRAIVAPNLDQAVPVLLQSYGLGPVRANTILLNWLDPDLVHGEATLEAYGRELRTPLRHNCNLVILDAGPDDLEVVANTRKSERRIDVWYRDNATGRLQLLLAYLVTRSADWRDARLRVLVAEPDPMQRAERLAAMEAMLEEVRIPAEAEIVEDAGPRSVAEISSASTLVFMPFRLAGDRPEMVTGDPIDEVLRVLRIAALCLASQDIALDAEPEAGLAGEAADAAAEALRKARKAEKELETARTALTRLEGEWAEKGEAAETDEALRAALEQARKAVEDLRRRAARAQAKADTAEQEAAAAEDTSIPPK